MLPDARRDYCQEGLGGSRCYRRIHATRGAHPSRYVSAFIDARAPPCLFCMRGSLCVAALLDLAH